MIIDTNILKNFACQIIAAHDKACQNDMEFKKNYIRVKVDSILKQLDAIRAVAPAFNMLKTAKIKFTEDYITEDEYHRVGFSDRHNDLVGICGGGLYGSSVFVNFENEKFVVCNWYTRHREINIDELIEKYWDDYPVRDHLGTIARDITIFAEAVAEKITSSTK
jgi:ABC-type protease/lipase transport system fused ATPase/permease subunit